MMTPLTRRTFLGWLAATPLAKWLGIETPAVPSCADIALDDRDLSIEDISALKAQTERANGAWSRYELPTTTLSKDDILAGMRRAFSDDTFQFHPPVIALSRDEKERLERLLG